MTMLETGRIIGGRYRLEAQIGEGGMGCVWRATQISLQRSVAIKFLYNMGPKPDQQAERFLREARIAAAVAHRNVVDIVDFGVEEHQPYMVMTFLKGETLGDRLDRNGALSVRELSRIISLSLRGLAAVHDADIVHRDLKPENIFLANEAEGDYPILLDFGISRNLDTASPQRSAMTTREGIMVGTPQYMSPEQARGLRDIDRRADIYSVGVILYEALTGELPYDSENIGDLIILIVRGGAPSAYALRPEVGKELSDVIARAMHVDRESRYQSAIEMQSAFLDAVESATGSPVTQTLSTMPRPLRSAFPPNILLSKPASRLKHARIEVPGPLPDQALIDLHDMRLPAPPLTPDAQALTPNNEPEHISGPLVQHPTVKVEAPFGIQRLPPFQRVAPPSPPSPGRTSSSPGSRTLDTLKRWSATLQTQILEAVHQARPAMHRVIDSLPSPLRHASTPWGAAAVFLMLLVWLVLADGGVVRESDPPAKRTEQPGISAAEATPADDTDVRAAVEVTNHASATVGEALEEDVREADEPAPVLSDEAGIKPVPSAVSPKKNKPKRKPVLRRKATRRRDTTPLIRRLDY